LEINQGLYYDALLTNHKKNKELFPLFLRFTAGNV